ncbi:MAG: hypothetical protein D6689_08345 [Deltaproteobacteria bacterium]|nr:MAG: hypothetical protein D6689_08345 [Deltaproteobacteria bacterium]
MFRRKTMVRALALCGPTAWVLGIAAVRSLYAYPGTVSATTPVSAPSVQRVTDVSADSWSVSTQTGAFTFSYPIALPSGRRGVAPSLALVYSSQQPVRGGIAAGWALPIPQVRVDTSQGRTDGVHYMTTLHGDARLVEVDDPRVPAGATAYRVAEGDSTFARYERVRDGGVTYWRARTTDGLTYTFGDRDDARDAPTAGGDGHEARWQLTRIEDRHGNRVDYHYQRVWGRAYNGAV